MSNEKEQTTHPLTPPRTPQPTPDQPPDPTTPPDPVAADQRITSLDVIRGVALLGIFPMNITAFAMPGLEYMLPAYEGEPSKLETAVWMFNRITVENKMMSLFSILFGAGIVLFADRARAKGHSPAALHYRRMAWLLAIGLAHAYLLFFGDILFPYAITGMVAYLFHRFRPAVLIPVGAAFCLLNVSISVLFGLFTTMASRADLRLTPDLIAADVAEVTRATGDGLLARIAHFAPEALYAQLMYPFIFAAQLLGLMLIGMGLFKLGVLTAALPTRRLLTVAALAIPPAAILTALAILTTSLDQPRMTDLFFSMLALNTTAALFAAVAYAALIAAAVRSRLFPTVQRLLAGVGRLAFTNYIAQSVIAGLIFWTPGFHLFGELNRLELWLVVLLVWAAQITASNLYLKRYSIGPLEWLWRCLTYARLLPLAKAHTSPNAA